MEVVCEEIDLLLKDKKDTKVVWLTNSGKKVLKYLPCYS
jgi:hypothetical protein